MASPLYFSLDRIDAILPLRHSPSPEGVGILSAFRSSAIVAIQMGVDTAEYAQLKSALAEANRELASMQ